MVPSVLIVDDEKHTREGLQQALQEHYDVSVAASADEAFNLMEAQEFEVIVTDLRMPGKSGLKVIDKALTLVNKPAVLMMTAYGNIESAVEAMKRGAVDFLTKPVQIERLEILIQRALKTKTLEVEVKQLHERLDHKFNIEGIVGHCTREVGCAIEGDDFNRRRDGHGQRINCAGDSSGESAGAGALCAGALCRVTSRAAGERIIRT